MKKITDELQKRITTFLADNKDCVVFVGHLDTDTIFMGHKDRVIANQIKNHDDSDKLDYELRTALTSDYFEYGSAGGDARGRLLLKISGMLFMLARDASDRSILGKILKPKGRKSTVSK